MRRQSTQRVMALIFGGAFLVAACGGGASTAPTQAPTAAPSNQPSVGPTEVPGTKEFTVGFTSPGLSSAPFLAAIDAMRGAGYTIDTPIIESSELLSQAVASGQFAFGSGANNAVLAANDAGANLRVVISRVNNEWTLYARTATIKTCADLGGKSLAIHSEGAVSTAMVKNYIDVNCAGHRRPTTSSSPARPTGWRRCLADQIDASPLELGDSLTIDAQASDKLLACSTASRPTLPDLQTTSIYVNGDFAAENPGTVLAMVKAVLTEHRRIAGDPGDDQGRSPEVHRRRDQSGHDRRGRPEVRATSRCSTSTAA